MGSGSDWTPFLQHLGIASLDYGFGGEGGGGVYHSVYDDFSWYTRFDDTDFSYGRALAQATGTTVMRLADADILPLDFSALADTVARYLEEIRKLATEKRDAAQELAREIDEGVPEATADPRQPFVAPRKETVAPYFDLSPLENASAELTQAAKEYESALAVIKETADPALLSRVNGLLRSAEQTLTREEGLPRRPWYKHYLYAPGFYTGYSVKTLPAVREAIEEKQFDDVDAEVKKTAEAIGKCAARVRETAAILRSP